MAGAPRRLARPGPGDPWRLLQLRLSGTAELAALAQGIGEIIFLGEPLAGLLVWLGLLLVSRPSAAWALAGAAASLPLAWLLGYDWASALAGFYGLNAALAGLAWPCATAASGRHCSAWSWRWRCNRCSACSACRR
ncbi:urea transporter [Pseudomonas aeruginosa]|nr:urea transporter [Pseudomonas aeruginosa]